MLRRDMFSYTAAAALAALGGRAQAQDAGMPKLAQMAAYKVGFAQTESNNPWRIAQTESMRSEAAKRGHQFVYTDAAA